MKHLSPCIPSALTALAITLSGVPLAAHPHPADASEETEEDAQSPSQFVGRYDGGGMEMAMGMIVRADGTFAWGLTVGALDLRAAGTWFEEDDTIIFVSEPKPVAPEFAWSGLERSEEGPMVRVVWSTSGEPFDRAIIDGECANGATFREVVGIQGWSPPVSCDAVVSLELNEHVHDVLSGPLNPAELGYTKGETIRFEFRPNDLGVANFDGTMGRLSDGVLTMQGPLGVLEMQKLMPVEE